MSQNLGAFGSASEVPSLGLVDEGNALIAELKSRKWLDNSVLDAASGPSAGEVAIDPVHALVSWGVGWLIEHLEPLKGWLEKLAGNPGEVASAAQEWDDFARDMDRSADDLSRALASDLADMEGQMIAAYTSMQQDLVAHVRVMARYSNAVGGAMRDASTMVGAVHDLVRDAIADVVALIGELVVLILCTFGFGTPEAVRKVAKSVAKWVTRLAPAVKAVPRMGERFSAMIERGGEWFDKIADGMRKRAADGVPTPQGGAVPVPAPRGGTEPNAPGGSVPPGQGGSTDRDDKRGPVIFTAPPGSTPEQIQQIKEYVDGCNRARDRGQLSPTGRVPTKGKLREDASKAAKAERRKHYNLYKGNNKVAGHVPDTTWTANPVPPEWKPIDKRVNDSLGGQTNRYPLGYKPTSFHFKDNNGRFYPPLPK